MNARDIKFFVPCIKSDFLQYKKIDYVWNFSRCGVLKTKLGIIIIIIYEMRSDYKYGTISFNMLLGNNIILAERQKQYCIQISSPILTHIQKLETKIDFSGHKEYIWDNWDSEYLLISAAEICFCF